MKYAIIICCAALLVGCSVVSHLERRQSRAEAAYPPRRTAPPRVTTHVRSEVRTDSAKYYLAGVDTDENGERIMAETIEEVVVVARSRTVAERNGAVSVDFVITLPREMQGNCRSVKITPVLHRQDGKRPLQELSIRGGLFSRVQDRNYWQFEQYVRIFRPDAYREQKAFERFVKWPYPEGVRLDSIVERPKEIAYYYTQQVATKGEGKTLRITLHGQVEGLDGSSYLLPVSDTLQYNISSMLSFIDRTPRYVTRVIEKYAVVKARNYLCFRLGDACIIDTLGDNGEQLAHIETLMERLISQAEFYVDSIILSASASPEGRMQTNERLARERAFTLKKYLTERFGKETDTLITVRWIAEDWPELSARIRTDRKITNRDAILKLIAAERNPDRREQTIRQRFPKDYAYIKSAIYPQLRAVNFKYDLRRKGMIKDTIHTTEPDTLYAEGIRLLEQRHYAEAVRILGPYEDINSAIAMLSAGSGKKAYDILSQIKRSDTTEYLAAIACARLGRIEEGRKHYEEACRMNENLKYRGDLDPEIGNLLKVKKE